MLLHMEMSHHARHRWWKRHGLSPSWLFEPYALVRGVQGAGGAPWGAGDLLMSFLGVVILHFGFRIHAQRRLMLRHGPEILGSTALSALFSLFATAAAARAAGLAPGAGPAPPMEHADKRYTLSRDPTPA